MLRGSFPSAGKKSGVIWCLGGAIINKIALIAPLAWAPHCCLQLYLGVKQRSCETPIVFVRFPIIITILPLESMAAHRTPGSKVMKFGTLIQDSPISPHSKYEIASP